MNEHSEDIQEPVEETAETEAVDPRDEQIEALTADLAEARNAVLRAQAEAQTIVRRLRQQMDDERKFGPQALAEALIPVLDNFALSMKALDQGASPEKIGAGIQSIERQLMNALAEAGVERIDPAGHQFDPERHEALASVETDEVPADTVVDVMEAGYVLHGRVLRPARVRVAVAP